MIHFELESGGNAGSIETWTICSSFSLSSSLESGGNAGSIETHEYRNLIIVRTLVGIWRKRRLD